LEKYQFEITECFWQFMGDTAMSEQDFVYGVFDHCEAAAAVVQALHGAGFKSEVINMVGPDTDAFRYVSAKIKNPAKDFFVIFGVVGALGGLWAGVAMAPTVPHIVSFQILTTLMAAISGSVVLAYASVIISALLTANNPQNYANVYQADMSVGAALVSVEADSAQERAIAQKILEEYQPIELVVRRGVVGTIIGVEPADQFVPEAEAPEKILSAAA
jgi:hypothetical protein